MSRHLILVSLCLLGACRFSVADESATVEKVPVERIVLFNSGVGFFEHRGEVEGDDEVNLQFKTADINDLLKSMVLEDLGGGHISTVSYGSRDPIAKTLKTFAIDLTSNPTVFQLLSQVRGREVIVHAPGELRGTVVGTESRQQAVPDAQPIRADYLNLLTDKGLQSVALSSLDRIEFADAALQKEFRAALTTLASANNTDEKTVTLKFLGDGKRKVRVGYIREAPVWKTSYRLVLQDNENHAENENGSLLQGWAIVENTGNQDWNNVQLSLVSGRPISFQMDLYSPLYASRPMVQHELYASLRPQLYDQDMDSDPFGAEEGALGKQKSMPRSVMSGPRRSSGARGLGGGGGFGGGEYGMAAEQELDLAISSVEPIGTAGDVGELFRYDIDLAVTLERQRSAMLPIVNEAVEASKVSIFNASVHAKHPLNGIRLKNTSDLHLMQGPITVFDGGTYAGDAKIADLPPGGERLVSYAMDLDIEVATKNYTSSEQLVTAKLSKGVLHTKYKHSREWNYTIKNSGGKSKTVLVEHPHAAAWNLVKPARADETTRDRYRFVVEAAPEKPTTVDVVEERLIKQTASVINLKEKQLGLYIAAKAISAPVKEALREVQDRRAAMDEMQQRIEERSQQLRTINNEQTRIRQNMEQVPRDSELYKRYIKKFTDQEDEVERLRNEIRELRAKARQQYQELEDFVSELELE